MHLPSYYVINAITIYRILAAPALLALIFFGYYDVFKWLLPVSFFTDLIDGYLARKYKATSVFGSRLDSIADDLTIVVSIVALFVFKLEFLNTVKEMISVLLALYLLQTGLAFWRYGRITSFHTWLAKGSALLQGLFLIFIFLLSAPSYTLFYIMAVCTALELVEEIVMVAILPVWKSDVKGIYAALKLKNMTKQSSPDNRKESLVEEKIAPEGGKLYNSATTDEEVTRRL